MSFGGWEGKDKEMPEYKGQSGQGTAREPRVIECSGCGAKNLIAHSVGKCDFCELLLNYDVEAKSTHVYLLPAGFYTVGLDIPAGTCNVTAVSETGYVSSSGAISEKFGLEDGDVYSFDGLKLRKNACLEVSGALTIELVFLSIDEGFSGRTYDMSGAIDLSTGTYDVGTDFKAGIYNIVAVSGSGHLYCREADVSELFGIPNDEAHEIRNVNFPKGAEFSVSGKLAIKLIPEESQGHTSLDAKTAAPQTQNSGGKDEDFSNATAVHTLSTGFYTVGIDIPAGKCDITAISGTGHVYSSGIGESFGIGNNDVSSFKGLKLFKSACLEVSGALTLQLSYRSISEGFSGRTYDISGAITLSAGNYKAGGLFGKRFKVGVYTIVAVSGSGYLTCDDPSLDESFGFDDGDVREIKNVNFSKGAKLSLSRDLTIKMIPEVTG